MSNAKTLFDNAEFFRAITVSEAYNVALGRALSPSPIIIADDPIIKELLKNRGYGEKYFNLPWREAEGPFHEINLTNLMDVPAGFGPVVAAIDVKNCLIFDEYAIVEDVDSCIIKAFKYYDQYYTLEEFSYRAL